MSRKITISKEVILDAALKMLIRDGYSSVNIKTLAKEIGCSTQPIAWHFDNMEGFRRELREYAMTYAAAKSTSGGSETTAASSAEDAVSAFEQMGRAYVKMALKKPNLFRFLYLGESPISKPYTLKSITAGKEPQAMIDGIAAHTGLSKEQVIRCIQNIVIYSHGLTTMVATGVFKADEKELMKMIKDASAGFVRMEMQAEQSNQKGTQK